MNHKIHQAIEAERSRADDKISDGYRVPPVNWLLAIRTSQNAIHRQVIRMMRPGQAQHAITNAFRYYKVLRRQHLELLAHYSDWKEAQYQDAVHKKARHDNRLFNSENGG